MKKTPLLSFVLSCFYFFQITICNAQCPPANFPDVMGFCPMAPVFCDSLDGYCNTLPLYNNPQVFPGCLGNVINNPSWFSFYAGSSFISLQVIPSNCQNLNGQIGMQGAIVEKDCSGDAIATFCDCTANPFMLTSSDFVIGQRYYVVLDGCAGDICDYEINVLAGTTVSSIAETPDINGPMEVCVGSTDTYFSNASDSLTWSINPLSPAIDYSFVGGNTGSEINIVWATPGMAEVCVTATNECGANSSDSCMTVVVNPILQTIETVELCAGDCVQCGDQIVCDAGIYTTVLIASTGCDSVVLCDVEVVPIITTDLEQVTLCAPDTFEVCGIPITASGINTFNCVGVAGCDSLVVVDLAIYDPKAIVQTPAALPSGGTIILNGSASDFFDASPNTVVEISWEGPGIIGPSDEPLIIINQPGTYCLTITMSRNGVICSDETCVEVAMADPCIPMLGPDLHLCFADTILIGAGSDFESYLWSTGDTTQVISVFESGVYSVETTDSMGCIGVDSITVTVEDDLIIALVSDTAFCENGSIDLDAGAFHQHLWSTGATSQNISVNAAGTYIVTVTSIEGCTNSDSIQVMQLDAPDLMLNDQYILCKNDSVELDAGDGFVSYMWSTGSNSQTTTVSSEGIYSVTVSDVNGCTAAGSTNVASPPILSNLLPPDLSFCEGESMFLSAAPGFVHYLWNTGDSTETIVVQTSGDYSVTVTDQTGCTQSDTTTVTVVAIPVFDLGPDLMICPGDTVTLDAGPGHDNYSWNTGESTQMIQVTVEGTYTVSETTPDGCQGSDQIIVSYLSVPMVDLGMDTFICHVNLPYVVDAGSGFSDYLWQDGSTEQTFTLTEIIEYNLTVTVTDSLGCMASDDVHLPVVICDAVFENQLAGQLFIQPNPANDFMHLVFKDFEIGEYGIEIIDVMGRKMEEQKAFVLNKNFSIKRELTHLLNGVYFIKVFNEKGMAVKRLVVE